MLIDNDCPLMALSSVLVLLSILPSTPISPSHLSCLPSPHLAPLLSRGGGEGGIRKSASALSTVRADRSLSCPADRILIPEISKSKTFQKSFDLFVLHRKNMLMSFGELLKQGIWSDRCRIEPRLQVEGVTCKIPHVPVCGLQRQLAKTTL